MSLDATRWAWQQQAAKGTAKLVLLSLADRADESHQCYPSISRLTADTGMDRKTVLRNLKTLEQAGLIEASRQFGRFNTYRLIGVSSRHETSTNIGTSTKKGTGTQIGTGPVPKLVPEPVPKLGHKPTIEPKDNILRRESRNRFTPDDRKTADWIFDLIRQLNPSMKQPNLDSWANEIRKLREIDKRPDSEIRSLFQWANQDQFWQANVLSPATLRKQWDRLVMQRRRAGGTNGNANGSGARRESTTERVIRHSLESIDREKAAGRHSEDLG